MYPNQNPERYSVDVASLIRQYEETALQYLFGMGKNPAAAGERDGTELDDSQSGRAKLAIRAEFEKQESALHQYLAGYFKYLKGELECLTVALNHAKSAAFRLEGGRGGRYHEAKMVYHSAEALRNLSKEEIIATRQLAAEHEERVRKIRKSIDDEMPATGYFHSSTVEGYKRLTHLMMRYGKPAGAEVQVKKGLEGYYALIRRRLDEILTEEMDKERRMYEQRLAETNTDFRRRADAIHAQMSEFPSLGTARFNLILTIVIFLVEVPLHFVFTGAALGLLLDLQGILLRVLLAIGLPVSIGMLFKYTLLDYPAGKQGPTPVTNQKQGLLARFGVLRLSILALTLALVISISMLNGLPLSNEYDAFKWKDVTSILKVVVFMGATLALSFIGAVFFNKTRNSWQKRRIVGFKKFRIKDLESVLNKKYEEVDAIEQQILRIRTSIQAISEAIEDHPQSTGTLRSVFKKMSESAVAAYLYGFQLGWRRKVAGMFKARQPIPVRHPFPFTN